MLVLRILCAVLLTGSVAYAAPVERVVNGTATSIENYPFMVSLRGPTGSHSCGATIISHYFVLTAAHCTYGRKASQLTIQFGVTNINSTGPNVVAVNKIIQHEDYDPYGIHNDVSLLRVEKPFHFNYKNVAPATLPSFHFQTPQIPVGAPGILTGWGLNATGGKIQQHLQEVNLKIYSDEECQARHGNAVTVRNICGGIDQGGKGQCSGDSGGPLLLDGQIQVGIVSWSIKPCTVAPYPGVYTKVSEFVHWIKLNMILH